MKDTKDIARDIARIYCTLTTEGMNTLASILIPVKVQKGDILLNEGDICRNLYYVDRGMVRQFYKKGGRIVTEHFSYEGRICFCIDSFLKQEPSRLMVEALENSVLYAIPYGRLQALLLEDEEISRFYRKLLEHIAISSQEHADSLRFETAQERYERLLHTKPEIVLRAPLNHLASWLQMTPETLSRVRAAHNSR